MTAFTKRCWRCLGTGDRNYDDAQVVWETCPVCHGDKRIPEDAPVPRLVVKSRRGEEYVY